MAIGHVAPGKVMPHTPIGAVGSGEVVVFADMIGVALADIGAGVEGQLAIQETWVLPKEAGLAIIQGQQLYWDAVNDEIDTTDTNVPAGKAMHFELAASPTVQVILNK